MTHYMNWMTSFIIQIRNKGLFLHIDIKERDIKITGFWNVTSCSLVDVYPHEEPDWPRDLTTEGRVQSQTSPCAICGGQIGVGINFFTNNTSVFPLIVIVSPKLTSFIRLASKLHNCRN